MNNTNHNKNNISKQNDCTSEKEKVNLFCQSLLFLTFSLVLIISFIFVFSINNSPALSSNAQEYYYAKIQNENAFFYSNPIDNNENMLFKLPNTYFVKLLDEENTNFYYCQYSDQYGYIKKSDVIVMDGTPINPYATSSFRIFSLEGIGLYSSPYFNEENKLAEIPYLTDDLTFYGYKIGEQSIPEKSDVWYYCRLNTNSLYGYVYSVFCDQLTEIPVNNEYFSIINSPIFGNADSPKGLSSVAMTFIIIGVSLPCVIVIYLLVKPTLLKDKVLNNKPKLKKRHGDYYEFDESDLN